MSRWWWLALATGLFGLATAAGAAECPPGEGTTVVVDSTALGGGVAVGCAPSATTGFEALAQAGFSVTPVQSNSAFVCRIDGRPGDDTEDCADTPPGTAFWSYWTADLGGAWSFNSRGAASAIPGDLEGWAFAAGSSNPPNFAVPAAPTSTTTTSTTTTSTTTTTTAPPTTTTTSTTTTVAPTTTAPSTTVTSTTSTSTSTTTSVPPTTVTTAPPPSTTLAAVASGDDPGGAGGFVVGAGAVAALAGAAVLVARRRRLEDGE